MQDFGKLTLFFLSLYPCRSLFPDPKYVSVAWFPCPLTTHFVRGWIEATFPTAFIFHCQPRRKEEEEAQSRTNERATSFDGDGKSLASSSFPCHSHEPQPPMARQAEPGQPCIVVAPFRYSFSLYLKTGWEGRRSERGGAARLQPWLCVGVCACTSLIFTL